MSIIEASTKPAIVVKLIYSNTCIDSLHPRRSMFQVLLLSRMSFKQPCGWICRRNSNSLNIYIYIQNAMKMNKKISKAASLSKKVDLQSLRARSDTLITTSNTQTLHKPQDAFIILFAIQNHHNFMLESNKRENAWGCQGPCRQNRNCNSTWFCNSETVVVKVGKFRGSKLWAQQATNRKTFPSHKMIDFGWTSAEFGQATKAVQSLPQGLPQKSPSASTHCFQKPSMLSTTTGCLKKPQWLLPHKWSIQCT